MLKNFLLTLFIAQFCQALQSQNWRHNTAVDSLVLDKKWRSDQPGFAVLIAENGQIVYEKQRGMANLEKKLPIRAETMFNIGSIAKQFTAACIFLLEERGLLKTEDSLQKYLPELPDFGATITLQHLISHTSGIPDHFEVANMQGNYKNSFCDFPKMVQILQTAPELGFAPGSDFAYCNTGYMLLALIVERVSGMGYHDFLVKNIFEPLGMKQSNGYQKEREGLPDGTISYAFQAKKQTFKHLKPTPNATGATGVQCTLRDFLQWDKNFDDPKIFSPAVLQKMLRDGHLNDGSPIHYGGGLLLMPFEGHPMRSHGGGWSSFLMEYRHFPESGITILVASNNDFSNPFPLADAIARVVLPKKTESVFTPENTQKGLPIPKEVVGKYISSSNFIRRIEADSQKIKIFTSDKSSISAYFMEIRKPDKNLIFKDVRGHELIFQRDEKTGKLLGFWWAGGHYFGVRRFYQKLDDVPADPKAFMGKYRNDKRKFGLRVRRDRKGQLVLKPVFFIKYALLPLGGNTCQVRGETVIIRFLDGEMVVGNDWANGLRLRKRG
jgi:CubicO group peptidase (beta-lactamase class C family)